MKTIAWFLLLAPLTLSGCADESATTPDAEETPMAQGTVGSSGGTLAAEGFSLIVPPGAFDTDVNLELYAWDGDHGFGNQAASPGYRLEGLPASFADSLTVRIAYAGSLDEESYIAVGTTAMGVGSDLRLTEQVVFTLHPATDASGFLEGTLPPPDEALFLDHPARGFLSEEPSYDSYRLATVTGFRSLNSQHVTLKYPASHAQYASTLLDHYEAAYQKVVDVGIGFEGRLWSWPAVVVVKNVSGSSPYGDIFPHKMKSPLIMVNIARLNASDLPSFEYIALATMMTVAAMIPDPVVSANARQYWWHAAAIGWLTVEEGGATAPSRPDFLIGNQEKVLIGLPIGLPDATVAHEYGASWSALLKYITDQYGASMIGTIYGHIRGGEAPETAFLTSLADPEYNYWPQFVDRFVSGQVYDLESALFMSDIDGDHTWGISSDDTTEQTWRQGYQQLSAQLHRIVLDHSQIDPNATLELTLDPGVLSSDYATLMAYQAKDGVLTYLGAGDTLRVTGLQELTLTGNDILAVVVNSFTEAPYTEHPTLTLRAKVKKPVVDFTTCRVGIWVISSILVAGAAEPYDGLWTPSWQAVGSFSGDTFTGTIDEEYHGTGVTGTLTATVDPVTLKVTTFSAAAVSTGSDGSGHWSISGISVPKIAHDPGIRLRCGAYQDETCTHISGLDYGWTPNAGDSEALVGHSCGSNSQIEITFSGQRVSD